MNNKASVGLVVFFALAAGYTLGWWNSHGDLKLKDQEIARLAAVAARPPAAGGTHRSFSSFRPSRTETTLETPVAEDRGNRTNNPSRYGRRGDRMMGGFFGGNTSSNFVAEWQAQAVNIRSNFFANANLTPEQQSNFDGLLSGMNDALKDRAAFWAEAVKEGKITGPEMFLRMTTDFSSTLVRAYDAMDRAMPPDWRTKAGGDFSVMRFVDPSIREAFHGLRPPRGGSRPEGSPPAQ
ncbi:MAG: hypothetical protein EPN23_00110 [Verrucomicrobia bacterium]|nr:MAG: hypothetical protein EPN23_00110 [Verrucomicrobiota bacterium]